MRKIVMIVLAMVYCLATVGCGSGNSDVNATPSQDAVDLPEEKQPWKKKGGRIPPKPF